MLKKILRTILFTPVAVILVIILPLANIVLWSINDGDYFRGIRDDYKQFIGNVYEGIWRKR